MFVTVPGMETSLRALHFLNASLPIFPRFSPMVTSVKFVHPKNAPNGTSVTPAMLTVSSPVQNINDFCPIIETVSGKATDVNDVQL